MFEKVNNIILKLTLEKWLFVCLALIAVTFIIGLIISIGSLTKFKRLAKNAAQNACEKDSCNGALKATAFMSTPHKTRFASRFCKVILALSAFMAAFIYAVGYVVAYRSDIMKVMNIYTALAIVIVAGLVMSFLAGLISMAIRNSASKTLTKCIKSIESSLKNEEPKPYGNTVINPSKEEVTFFNFQEPVSEVVEEKVIEVRDDQIAAAAARVQQNQMTKTQNASAAQPTVAPFAQSAPIVQPTPIVQPAPFIQPTPSAQTAPLQNTAVKAQTAKTVVMSFGADEVIAKIDKISKEGAPLATMKEVALQLQQERAKPENKTPERQRKLNESLATLLKAMSGATKR